jgi:hypothetical protein
MDYNFFIYNSSKFPWNFWEFSSFDLKLIFIEPNNCLQFYVHLGPESPLDERQIMEDRLSCSTGNMPQTWSGQLCSQSTWAQQKC